jgi:hypothetical protein
MISHEQWDAIRQRFMDAYRDYVDSDENGSGYKPALDKAMEDIQLLLNVTHTWHGYKPMPLATTSSDVLNPTWIGTCRDCMIGICKKDYPHT